MPNFIRGMMGDSGTALVSVGKSALYQSANNEYLSMSPSSGNRDIWTFSCWLYRGLLGSSDRFFGSGADTNNYTAIKFETTNALRYEQADSGSFTDIVTTTQVFRDIGWYHIVCAIDTTSAVEADRVILYVNGLRMTAFSTANYPAQNVDTDLNSTTPHHVGTGPGTSGNTYDGYMAETVFIDGTKYAASDFGEFDSSGLFWTPKSSASIKELTFGTNGFYLDNTTNAQTDASGEGNNFTNNNTVTLSTHTPTNTEALPNILQSWSAYMTLTNGNKTVTNSSSYTSIPLSLPVKMGDGSGIYWIEFRVDSKNSNQAQFPLFGVAPADHNFNVANSYAGSTADSISYRADGTKFTNGSDSAYGAAFVVSDVIGMLITESSGTVTMYKQTSGTGSFATQGNLITSLSGDYIVAILPMDDTSSSTGPATITCRIDSSEWGNSSLPAGAKALNTTNIAANTTRTAADSKKYFDTILYEGNGAGQRVGQFQPFGNAFTVGNGALFNGDDNYLGRTQTGGSNTVWTFSTWIKKCENKNTVYLDFGTGTPQGQVGFNANGSLYIYNGATVVAITTQNYRDLSQWTHFHVAYNTGASGTDKCKISVDGALQEWFDTDNRSTAGAFHDANQSGEVIVLGNNGNYGADAISLNGYMAECVMLDGTASAASNFGQTDTSTNRWVPKDVSGLDYSGANSFYLQFGSSGSDLGDDDSGEGNDLANTNTVVQVTDSPTSNASVLNPYNASATAPVLSNGNRAGNAGGDSGNHRSVVGTLSMPANSGKYYWEMTSAGPSGVYQESTGIVAQTAPGYPIVPAYGAEVGASSTRSYSLQTNGKKLGLGVYTASYATAYTAGVVIGVGYDSDNGILKYWRANSDLGNAFTGINTSWNYAPAVSSMGSGTYTYAFAEGDLTYSIPTGYQTLVQDNLPSSDKFVSAFSWIKNRDATDSHMLFDRLRGIKPNAYDWSSDLNAAQVGRVESVRRMLVGGVELGNFVGVNTANESYVLWNWMMEATGTGSSNTDGTINTTKTLVDTTLGMSISTYTGASVNGAGTTIGHGLGVAPEMIIVKNLSYAGSAAVYHSGIWTNASAPQVLYLSGTAAAANDTNVWGTSGAVTSSTFTVGDWQGTNYADQLFVAYCFVSSQFISIGKYIGNGNADGPFVPFTNSLGVPISPKYVLGRNYVDAGAPWFIVDDQTSPYNVRGNYLVANSTAVESASNNMDFVTGGAKWRATGYWNESTKGVVYLAIGTPIIDTDGRIIAGR